MPLPAQIPVKYSEDDAQFISIRPLVRQTFRPAELIDMIVSVTGKDPYRVQQILRSGTIVFNSYRYWWDAIDAASPELATFLAAYPDADPSRPFRRENCTEVILESAGTPPRHSLRLRSHECLTQTPLPHAQPLGCAPRPRARASPRLPRILLRPSRRRLRPATRPRRNRPASRNKPPNTPPAHARSSTSNPSPSHTRQIPLPPVGTKACATIPIGTKTSDVWLPSRPRSFRLPLCLQPPRRRPSKFPPFQPNQRSAHTRPSVANCISPLSDLQGVSRFKIALECSSAAI